MKDQGCCRGLEDSCGAVFSQCPQSSGARVAAGWPLERLHVLAHMCVWIGLHPYPPVCECAHVCTHVCACRHACPRARLFALLCAGETMYTCATQDTDRSRLSWGMSVPKPWLSGDNRNFLELRASEVTVFPDQKEEGGDPSVCDMLLPWLQQGPRGPRLSPPGSPPPHICTFLLTHT